MLSLIYFAIRANKARRLKYIEQYRFHKGIRHKLSQRLPQLTEQQAQGLRDYFRICHRARNRMVSMPAPALAKNGIKRSWRLACVLEQINPKKPLSFDSSNDSAGRSAIEGCYTNPNKFFVLTPST